MNDRAAAWRLFLLSFLSIYFEIAFIRWSAAHVPLVAYIVNLALLSAFFGLSLGFILAERKVDLYALFPAAVLANVALSLALNHFQPAGFSKEGLFFIPYDRFSSGLKNLILGSLFLSLVMVFIPLGQATGKLFERLPKLSAYSVNLLGALTGGLVFGLFSLSGLNALVWFAVGLAVAWSMLGKGTRLIGGLLILLSLGVVWSLDRGNVLWSPYNRLEITEPPSNDLPGFPKGYNVRVNRYFYQNLQKLDFHPENLPRQPEELYRSLVKAHDYYHLPYALAGGSEVLVVGCGAGNDVSAALLSGIRSIDAVDIDPAIIDIGRHLHPDAPYANPGVRVLAQDARAYFQRCDKRYDLIVFGYLDSQSLFSSLSSVRLDAYVYTAESIRDARRLLKEGGHLVLYFAAARDWISQRLFATLEASFPGQVTAFRHVWEAGDKSTGRILLLAGDPATLSPPHLQRFERISFPSSGTAPATDDWPFLYLHQRAIPVEYLYFMAFLVLLAVLSLLFSGSLSRFGKRSFYFFFLGAGFMIMETRAITQLTLFFGSTWVTSLLIVSGILIVLWAANWIVMKSRPIPYAVLYGLLLGSLLLQALAYGVLKEAGGAGVILLLSVVYALPFFAAGLLFSQSFSAGTRPSADLGWNALGAFSGGFAEYLSMILGFNALAFIAMAFYAAAWALLPEKIKKGS